MKEVLRKIGHIIFLYEPSLYAESPKGFSPNLRRFWAKSSEQAASMAEELAISLDQNYHALDFIVIADKLCEHLTYSAIKEMKLPTEKEAALISQVRAYSGAVISKHVEGLMAQENHDLYKKDPLRRESYRESATEIAGLLCQFREQQIPPDVYTLHLGLMRLLSEMSTTSGTSYNVIFSDHQK